MDVQDPVKVVTDAAKTAKDILPQTTTQTDGALATLVGWFNNVVLYPVKRRTLRIDINWSALKMTYISKLRKSLSNVSMNRI